MIHHANASYGRNGTIEEELAMVEVDLPRERTFE
jgi:hypothetical protein